jgi:hypothetical protein
MPTRRPIPPRAIARRAPANDTIVFNLSGTIALASGLPSVQHTLEIDGTGQTITIDGGGAYRVFQNLSGVLTLNNLTIANGETTGNGGAAGDRIVRSLEGRRRTGLRLGTIALMGYCEGVGVALGRHAGG